MVVDGIRKLLHEYIAAPRFEEVSVSVNAAKMSEDTGLLESIGTTFSTLSMGKIMVHVRLWIVKNADGFRLVDLPFVYAVVMVSSTHGTKMLHRAVNRVFTACVSTTSSYQGNLADACRSARSS